jgi:hypothetical protein
VLEYGLGPAPERAGGREQVARDEEAAPGLGGDLHGADAIRARYGSAEHRL